MSLHGAITRSCEKVKTVLESLADARHYDPVEAQRRWISEIEQRLRIVEEVPPKVGTRRNKAPGN